MRRLLVLLTAALAIASGVPAAATVPVEASCEKGVRLVGRGAPAVVADPIGNVPCPGVRPGALVNIPSEQSGCSFNFLFDAYRWVDDERVHVGRYIGTAGHCILNSSPMEQSWEEGGGPEAQDAAGERVGEFAYAVLTAVKDFALVRLDEGVEANPQMCYWGGPTGINSDLTDQQTRLRHFGQGVYVSWAAPARTAYTMAMRNPDEAIATGVAVWGDSGSGIVSDDGRAVGVIVALGGSDGDQAGTIAITRLGRQVARAEQVLGLELDLVTAPLLRR